MNAKRLISLYKKEMLDVLRDKKTIIIMILIPLLLYPLIFFGGLQIVSMISKESAHKAYRVSFQDVDTKKELCQLFQKEETSREYFFKVLTTDTPKEELEEKTLDAYITMEEVDGKQKYQVFYNSSITDSQKAASMLEDVLEDYREQLQKENVENAGLSVEKTLYPLECSMEDLSSREQTAGSIFGSVIPMLMVVSILLGAMYPAIDLTAGEKERGTMETLLTLPVSNYELIMSKLLAVSTLSVVSALLNFLSMGIMGFFVFQSLLYTDDSAKINQVTFLPAVLLTLLGVITFSLFVSVLSIMISIFAKTFKEAENYITPFLLVIMLCSYIGFLPNVELNAKLSMIPVANVVLLVKGLFAFQYNIVNILIVLASNVCYSILGVLFLGRIFNSERLLFGEEGGLVIFESRINIKKGQMPSVLDAFLVLACCMMIMIYLGTFLQRKFGLYGNSIMQFLMLGLCLLYTWYIKSDKKKLFSLNRPGIRQFLGGLLLWASTYLAMLLVGNALAKFFPESTEGTQELFAQYFETMPIIALVLLIGIVPAICEEMLFRGLLFGTLREHIKIRYAILISAAVFGLYHMSLIRFVTTGVLGVACAYAVHKSKSIFTSMTMHGMNNVLSVLLMCYPTWFSKHLPFLAEEKVSIGTIGLLLAVGAVMAVIGVFLLKGIRKK